MISVLGILLFFSFLGSQPGNYPPEDMILISSAIVQYADKGDNQGYLPETMKPIITLLRGTLDRLEDVGEIEDLEEREKIRGRLISDLDTYVMDLFGGE